MRKIGVLVDNTAQFPRHSFPGQNSIRIATHNVAFNGKIYPEGDGLKVSQLPQFVRGQGAPKLQPPTAEKFNQILTGMGSEFDEVLVLVHSSHLSSAFQNASLAASSLQGRMPVVVVDTNTFSAGLGMLAQLAAQLIHEGANLAEVEHIVRQQAAHTYSIVCCPGLSYLAQNGIIDPAQAIAGELLSMMPVFSFEDERLTPIEKMRNIRNITEFFIEFVEEFDNLYHIAVVQSVPPLLPETRSMRQVFLENYPQTTYSEHNLNLATALLFSPKMVGLIAVEKASEYE
ncbi:MAG: DegV family protein [Bellilinea sp.]